MLGALEHGHIRADFGKDADCGEHLDTRHRQNQVECRKIFFCKSEDQHLQRLLAGCEVFHVGENDTQLSCLMSTDMTIYGGLDAIRRSFEVLV